MKQSIQLFEKQSYTLRIILFVWWLFFIVLYYSDYSIAQSKKVEFERISTKDGLSQSTVNCILQDNNGFLWIGTIDGLNRYDGYSFKIYKTSENDSTSISGSYIYCLFEDYSGSLWIGTRSGLNRYDKYSDNFIHYQSVPGNTNTLSNDYVRAIYSNKSDELWVGTDDGLNKFNVTTKTIQQFHHQSGDPNSICNNSIRCLFEDNFNCFWVGTLNGLTKFDNKSQKVTQYTKNLNKPRSISDNSIQAIYQDRSENLWIGTTSGLNLYDRQNDNYISFLSPELKPPTLDYINITSIFEDLFGNLWVGSWDGLHRYDKKTKTFSTLKNESYISSSLSNNAISDIFEDEAHILWVATWGGGLNKYDPYKNKFTAFSTQINNLNSLSNNYVCSIFEDNIGTIWIGTWQGGLNKLDPKTQLFKHVLYNSSDVRSISDNTVYAICQDKVGSVWIGTREGLNKVDPVTNMVIEKYSEYSKNQISNNIIRCLLTTKDGIIWIGTENGLDVLNPIDNSIIHYINNPLDSTSLCSNKIRSLLQDDNGNVWVGTEFGLCRFNSIHKCFVTYKLQPHNKNTLSHNYIRALQENPTGFLWIGTNGGGLYRLDIKNNTWIHLREVDGLPNDVILGILTDEHQHLWISTNNGLSKYEPENKTFHNYSQSDGLPGNEFNGGAYYKSKTGKLFFGGIDGFCSFYPDSIIENTYQAPVVITDFQLFNSQIKIGPNSVLKTAIGESDELSLPNTDYIFSLEFASLHYSTPQRNKYAYMLEGVDTGWNFTNANRRFATYTNLNPGSYIFKVKGSNSDGIWNDDIKTLEITIMPPFWKQWWFIGILLVVCLYLIYCIIKIREKSLLQKKDILEQTLKLRTAEILQHHDEISAQRDEIEKQKNFAEQQNEQILKQNRDLERHRLHLERLVDERTMDLLVAKEEAEESDRLKSAFLSNLSHELRTPMNAIVGFAQLLTNPDLPDNERKECSNLMSDNVNSLLLLIDEILDISKLETEQIEIVKSKCKINTLLQNLYLRYNKELQKQKKTSIIFKLKKAIDDEQFSIKTDIHRIEQIIANLLNNSVKYTDQGFIEFGYTITNIEHRNALQFYVQDSGIGIKEEKLKILFDRFRKVDDNENRLYSGAGLGLAITKKLVKLMGGEIWVDSKEGKGSTFYFTVPLDDEAIKTLIKPAGEDVKFIWKDKTVLIVEDNHVNYKYLEVSLRDTQAFIVWAKNGREAVEIFENNQNISIILMDIQMPIMNGFEATRRIKQIKPEVPIIAQTAFAMEEERAEIIKAGCDDYIKKPVILNHLLSMMQNLMLST